MINRHLHIILVTTLILSCGGQSREAAVSPSGKVVKIGVIAPMSGPDKKSGENALAGMQTALQLQPLLHNGDKIELVVEDSQGTPEQTLSSLEKLRREEDVSGVLLMAKSDAVIPLVPVADQYKIPILALIATHPDITKNNQFISQLSFDDMFQGTVAALYVRDEMLIDRVAVFYDPGNSHYSFLENAFVRAFASAGGNVVERIPVNSKTEDLQKVLERLRKIHVQLLYLAVPPEQVINISRSGEEIGWTPKKMGSDGMLAAILLQHRAGIGLVNGMMATDIFSNLQPMTQYGKKIFKLYRKRFSKPGTSYTILGCEGTSILIHAIDRCSNKYDRLCVNRMLRYTKGYEVFFGRLTIREDGKAERPIFVNRIEGQELKFLVKVY
jgi:branched-chain amino acid transport system substrate-binding protein